MTCFNSLQVDYNLMKFGGEEMTGKKSFNSLQVDYNLPCYMRISIHSSRVSIPYRQTIIKNNGLPPICHPNFVSIPYRQTIIKVITSPTEPTGLSFNSLQVDYKPLSWMIEVCHPLWVSIPYRQTINGGDGSTPMKRDLCFNSLQVDYKH